MLPEASPAPHDSEETFNNNKQPVVIAISFEKFNGGLMCSYCNWSRRLTLELIIEGNWLIKLKFSISGWTTSVLPRPLFSVFVGAGSDGSPISFLCSWIHNFWNY